MLILNLFVFSRVPRIYFIWRTKSTFEIDQFSMHHNEIFMQCIEWDFHTMLLENIVRWQKKLNRIMSMGDEFVALFSTE